MKKGNKPKKVDKLYLQRAVGKAAHWGSKEANVSALCSVVLCALMFTYGGIAFTLLEKIILLSLSLICGQMLPWAYTYIRSSGKMPWGWFLVFSAFAAFAFVGSTLFLYPIGVQEQGTAYLLFLLAWLWVVPLCLCAVAWMLWASAWMAESGKKPLKERQRLPQWALFLICFGSVMLVGAVYIIGYNPAVSCADSNYQFAQAMGAVKFSDWHAPLHTLFITLLVNIWNSPTFVALVQCAFFAFVYARGALLLAQLGMRKHFIIIFTVAVVLFRPNALLLITLWKDVPYTAALLWLMLILAKILLVESPKPKVLAYIELALCLPLVCLLRLNGIVPAILSATTVLIASVRWNKVRALAGVTAAVSLVLVVSMLVVPAMGFKKENPGGKYIALSQDLFAVEQAGGRLPAKAYDYFEVLRSDTEEEWWYTPYWAFSSYNLDVPMAEFIGVYAEAFVKNPVTMLQSILLRTEGAWSVKTSPEAWIGLANYSGTINELGFWKSQYKPRADNIVTYALDFLGEWTSQEPFVNIFWRVAWVMLLALAAGFVAVINQKKKALLLLVPIAGQYISLALSTGWSDYRYFWSIGLLSAYFIAVVLCNKSPAHSEPAVLL